MAIPIKKGATTAMALVKNPQTLSKLKRTKTKPTVKVIINRIFLIIFRSSFLLLKNSSSRTFITSLFFFIIWIIGKEIKCFLIEFIFLADLSKTPYKLQVCTKKSQIRTVFCFLDKWYNKANLR